MIPIDCGITRDKVGIVVNGIRVIKHVPLSPVSYVNSQLALTVIFSLELSVIGKFTGKDLQTPFAVAHAPVSLWVSCLKKTVSS